MLVICEPICISIPINVIFLNRLLSLNKLRANFESIPNLFSDNPVEMYGCVCASTSGLTRIATRATFFISPAIAFISSNSSSDSALIINKSFCNPNRISLRVFPTPVKINLFGSTPASNALFSSPSELTSTPLPRSTNVFITLRLKLLFAA